MTRFERKPRPSRAEKDTAMQTGTRDPDVLDRVCRILSSSCRLHFISQRLSKFSYSGADSRFYGSRRLIQLACRLFISQFGEKCGFDRLSFFYSQDLERIPQQPSLLLKQARLLRINNVRCRP